ncbi:MAG: translation initiation factor IF-2 [Candidatus Marinimicrobia bacterium]|nr:translation initiation factor IF-2 [Candidatus Neomarinimicrobiota bacterium]MBT3936287.1 translation initiation factor IF-2 [Candidatus Neomarinimicrobiota bacterium]MBT4637112.1 translation initiation factor IF-2 [Candidatus Neomarinimicrobiota bacterium]MBT4735374.1 translation initiation factor IF-2 [Candidatus Neomarinimicrobiota bacterium]MBT6470421.1 translation initiation factor IF-2 [Candidatus Neomarinimicrobiota bacterium]
MAKGIRIFQIAKELNISHTDILSFLKSHNIEVGSHMSPVNEDVHQVILSEFAKDKASVERFRKEQVRKEIHDTRLKEKKKDYKKLQILSLSQQRELEKKEKASLIEAEKQKKEAEVAKKKAEIEKEKESKAKKNAEDEKSKKLHDVKKKVVAPKKKLRKISLADIESEIGSSSKRPSSKKHKKEAVQKSVKDAVRQTMAKMDTKSKKKVYKKQAKDDTPKTPEELIPIEIAEFSNVEEVGKLFSVASSDIIQKCMALGMLATINQRLDWDVIELLAEEYGYKAEKMTDIGEELFSEEESEEDLENAITRAPIVTVMGHVDHGKTSLLDYIRKENVVSGESGGITQHIGAYKVDVGSGKNITFLDTPGHEAFTAMRARGAQVTDVVILVVAANDSVMPQTIEAISHAKAAKVPLIIAINKMDVPGADPEKVRRELSEHEVLVEQWGGKIQSVEISAKTGAGISDLMDSLVLETDVLDLKASQDTLARGSIIDSKLDRGLGPVGTVLIQKGILKVGDPFICSDYSGKVRSIMNEQGERLKEAYPSDAVQIQGFDQVPQAADMFIVVANEKDLKRISSERQRVRREIEHKKMAFSLDHMSSLIAEGTMKNLPIIVKGDVDGSIEALSETLEKMNTDEVGIKVIHKAVGMVTESDVLLAEASKAVIIGFHVQVSSNAKLQAQQAGVDIRTYNVIYQAVDELKLALEGLLEPDKVETMLGQALVQEQFKIPKIGFIAGSKVTEGLIIRNGKARVLREGEVICEGLINSLKRFKDDAKEVKEGLECGIGVDGLKKFLPGDIIQVYEIREVKRKLEKS